jgi:hypothetical protein
VLLRETSDALAATPQQTLPPASQPAKAVDFAVPYEAPGGQGISATVDDRTRLQATVQRLAGRRWHVNTAVQFSALEGLDDLLMSSPVPVVIDHFAGAQASHGYSNLISRCWCS